MNREPEIVFNLFDEWLLSLGNERTIIDRREMHLEIFAWFT